jgi:hypothetical protein
MRVDACLTGAHVCAPVLVFKNISAKSQLPHQSGHKRKGSTMNERTNFERQGNAEAARHELQAGLDLPAELLSAPEVQRALDVAAGVVARIDQLHGNGRQIVRSEQTGTYMGYHHGMHTREVATGGANYLGLSETTNPADIGLTILAGAYHDIVQGQKEPGTNEALSAQIAARELAELGYDQTSIDRVVAAVHGTQLLFGEGIIRQRAYESDDPVVVATAVGDLSGLAKSYGPLHSFTLFAEFNPDVLTAQQDPLTHREIMQIIDATPGATERLGNYIAKQEGFFSAVDYPPATHGAVDALFPLRNQNAALLRDLGGALANRTISAVEAFAVAEEYEG